MNNLSQSSICIQNCNYRSSSKFAKVTVFPFDFNPPIDSADGKSNLMNNVQITEKMWDLIYFGKNLVHTKI